MNWSETFLLKEWGAEKYMKILNEVFYEYRHARWWWVNIDAEDDRQANDLYHRIYKTFL